MIYDFSVSWTNEKDGWNLEKRLHFLARREIMLQQTETNEVPTFTKHGYKRLKIPIALYDKILSIRNSSELVPEACHVPNSLNNCYSIRQVHAVPLKHGKRELIGILGKTYHLTFKGMDHT